MLFQSKMLQNLKKLQTPAGLRLTLEGKLTRVVGLTLEAVGCQEPIGSRVLVSINNNQQVEAEVVGFEKNRSFLMCIGSTQGIAPGARIIPTYKVAEVQVSDQLLGRVLDGAGNPLDGKGAIPFQQTYSLYSEPYNPLQRKPVAEPLDVGVRSINSLLTVGKGQRLGLFAGSGVGKSVLLSMMTRYTKADVIVVGLIGERGREVKEFIENNLGEEGLRRSVVVAAPADESPLMRLHGALVATSIAEYFRDQGKQVLLLMDSLTRYAQAQREIGLSIGEPPTTKGYPPSVFTKLPQLVERAGNGCEGGGAITAIYTVLTEGDDQQDPIADAARAILDGHIVLSRRLAEAGQFPAIDIEASISRVMSAIVSEEHAKYAMEFKHLMSVYSKNQDLISVGAYVPGHDALLDRAVQLHELLLAFLRQQTGEAIDYANATNQLAQIFNMNG
jgi:flagellum-specific ATP synthase